MLSDRPSAHRIRDMPNRRCIVLLQGLALLAAACTGAPQPATAPATTTGEEPRLQAAPTTATQSAVCFDPAAAPAVTAPADPECANDALLAYDGLLVIGPHPDDEALGFGGLSAAYRAVGKPVNVIVTTDGDAYCEACRLWKTSSTTGAVCDALDLSNLVDASSRQLRGSAARREHRRRRRARPRHPDLPRLPRHRPRGGVAQLQRRRARQAAAPLRLLEVQELRAVRAAATAKGRRRCCPPTTLVRAVGRAPRCSDDRTLPSPPPIGSTATRTTRRSGSS